MSILPGASMQQQRVVLGVTALRPHVTAVQGPNYSWLGYPGDTTPSSRDLLPGLTAQQQEQQQQQDDERPGGAEDGEGAAAAATDDGKEEEGEEEGSEGPGATLGGQPRQQVAGAAGPAAGREHSSSSSSSSAVSSWRQQVRMLCVVRCVCGWLHTALCTILCALLV